MVLLTMTPAIVQAIQRGQEFWEEAFQQLQIPSDPSLADPNVGKPISHSQLIGISKLLKQDEAYENDWRLSTLLKGSKIYIPPPPPKKEPTPEYKALMERLRKEEEARAYERMIHPPIDPETFQQRFPVSPHAHLYPTAADLGEEVDEVTYADVHRQMILIINVLVSIIACSVFIWIAARHWSTPKRLGLSMAGSGVIAIAEIVIYSGYVRKVQEAKLREKKKPEIKEVVETWVIDGAAGKKSTLVPSMRNKEVEEGMRHRHGKHR
ncbi:hypothetical protein GQ43DRAFT_201831 [Delitschia confertaspora ATCC 74209]|uniref:ATPase, vacuolar ER assembly factor, Vma12 n=1 Tax=Delitschia confertaspora ATCC 74209 TaxID=1513339 RepID=A0A9P4JDN0_9PLEO|nr:hypothetical protein GQ43DRAFT_201831 [Delitschia confertaspora ATCC 74209]